MSRMDFSDHSRVLGDNRYVYAVVSRRVGGLSIGINLNPDKVCNFACPYCQVDRRTPGGPRAVDLVRLRAELDHLLGLVSAGELWSVPPFDRARPEHQRVGDISIAGDGEPTTAPAFADAVRVIGAARAAHELDHVPLSLLTNATRFQLPAVRGGLKALAALDGQIWAKLDAGTEPYFHRVDGTTIPLQRVLDNLAWAAERWPVVLQCMFHTWDEQPPSEQEILAWAGRIRDLLEGGAQISEVQIYTVARPPADGRVGPLSLSALQRIARSLSGLGLSIKVSAG